MREQNRYCAGMHGEWSGTRIAAAIAALKATGLSDQRIGKLAGVNRSTANRWARGLNRPDHDAVRQLAARIWREHPDIARELVEASGYPWAEPTEVEAPWTPLDEFFGSAEDAEEVRAKIRRHKGADADYWISAIETALSQPPAGADDCPGPGGAQARRQG
jgi:transcriptional regulator with XRE-family HTH domain